MQSPVELVPCAVSGMIIMITKDRVLQESLHTIQQCHYIRN
jgi:hypothetical protein